MDTPEPRPIVNDLLRPSFIIRCQELVKSGHTDAVPLEWRAFLEACAGSGIYLEPYGPQDFLPR